MPDVYLNFIGTGSPSSNASNRLESITSSHIKELREHTIWRNSSIDLGFCRRVSYLRLLSGCSGTREDHHHHSNLIDHDRSALFMSISIMRRWFFFFFFNSLALLFHLETLGWTILWSWRRGNSGTLNRVLLLNPLRVHCMYTHCM